MPGGGNAVRAFIAIDLPEDTRQALSRATGGLRTVAERGVRWVDSRNLHLTLKFLGDVPLGKLDPIQHVLMETASKRVPFTVQPDGLGSFPPRGRPRVIWVGIHPPEDLAALAKDLEQRLIPLGFAAEARPFAAHMTIGRVRDDIQPMEIKAMQMALSARSAEEFTPFEVRAVHLYRSQLRPSGAVYTRLFSAPLSGYNQME